ncbi:hypothetical protein EIP91_007271 [Steccherinum ochraceum]|uniref:Pdp3-interacting factor 1 n=1 Tax=Steccherinum ochraceum TaxID=92696 RepID=A0A4R0RA40_9APHY|nr:hypothetical protein EIP91_007271 [Steccherinum ochraceum]
MTEDIAPKSSMPYPPLHLDKKFVALSDWDGTITTRDSNDYLTDHHGFGLEKRREGNVRILSGEPFRDEFRLMLKSVAKNGHSIAECQEILKQNISLDPGFLNFYNFCKANDIPFVIISSGMAPLIRAVLSKLIGDEEAQNIEIIANDAQGEGSDWEIKYRHEESPFGHDKSQAILPYRRLPNPPTIFFFGDGVSDMSAARHADVLFVKKTDKSDNDLAAYCTREGIPHILFRDFNGALDVVKGVVDGKLSVEKALDLKDASAVASA